MTKFKDRRVFTMGYNQYGHDNANVYQRYFEGMHKQLSPTTASQLRVHMRGFEVRKHNPSSEARKISDDNVEASNMRSRLSSRQEDSLCRYSY